MSQCSQPYDPIRFRNIRNQNESSKRKLVTEVERYGFFHADMTSDLLERLDLPAENYIAVRYHHTLAYVIKQRAVAISVFQAENLLPHVCSIGRPVDGEWSEKREVAMVAVGLKATHLECFKTFLCIIYQDSSSLFDL